MTTVCNVGSKRKTFLPPVTVVVMAVTKGGMSADEAFYPMECQPDGSRWILPLRLLNGA